jgi:hypothetical protein
VARDVFVSASPSMRASAVVVLLVETRVLGRITSGAKRGKFGAEKAKRQSEDCRFVRVWKLDGV